MIFALAAMYFAWQANQASVLAIAGQGTAQAASTEIAFERDAAETARAEAEEAQRIAEISRAEAEVASTAIAAEKEIAETAQAAEATARVDAVLAQEQAEAQRLVAQSRGLAAQARNYLDQDLSLALLLGVEAFRHADTVEARSALLTALQRRLERNVVPAAPVLPLPAYGDITAVAIHPDGETIAIGSLSGQILLWDPADPAGARRFAAHGTQVLSLAFSPDGRVLASGGLEFSLNLWQVSTGTRLAERRATELVLSLAFSPAGDRLASAGSGIGRRVVLWDVEDPASPEEIRVLTGPRDDVRQVAWSPDPASNIIAGVSTGVDPRLWVWNTENADPLRQTTRNRAPYWSVAWSPDGRLLAGGDEAGNVFLWEAATLQQQGGTLLANPTEVLGLAFTPDGRTLLVINGSGVFSFWDVESREVVQKVTAQARSAAFSTGRTRLALGSGRDNVSVWDLTLQQPLREEVLALDGAVESLVFLEEDTWLAATAADRGTALWQVRGSEPEELLFIQEEALSRALSPDGEFLALGAEDGGIRILDESGDLQVEIEKFDTPILSLAFQPGTDLFAFGDERGLVQLWYLGENRAASPFTLPTQYEGASTLAFSADGVYLASGFQNGAINLWELQGESIEGSLPWFGQRAGIASLAFSPDGSMLASGSPSQTIVLWHVGTRQAIGDALAGAGAAVTALAYPPSGTYLLAGEEGGIVARWELDPPAWVERACELAGRNLKEEEWQVFLPDELWRQTCPQWPLES